MPKSRADQFVLNTCSRWRAYANNKAVEIAFVSMIKAVCDFGYVTGCPVKVVYIKKAEGCRVWARSRFGQRFHWVVVYL
jgi:hypothetical protein